ncbi:MAG: hypothetical protein DMG50_09965 [Acidobacteria bacterium]|nr:MAG: hypothetical protein DMG50_09965 [Acidobacteriota bacterium]
MLRSKYGDRVPIKTYKDLDVFQVSYRLALNISKSARNFPGPEQFELARQLCRAAGSIPANVVEGWAKRFFCGRIQALFASRYWFLR